MTLLIIVMSSFADDTSLFSRTDDLARSSLKLIEVLENVKLWAGHWEVHFNADKTEEVIMNALVNDLSPTIHHYYLGNDQVAQKLEHKQLEVILHSKLEFESHIRQAILITRRGIGMIRYPSKYVSRNVLDKIYKFT